MKNGYIVGILAGFALLLFAIPLGELYGNAYIYIGSGMATEQYIMLMERAIISFQIIGGLISGLFGIAFIFTDKNK